MKPVFTVSTLFAVFGLVLSSPTSIQQRLDFSKQDGAKEVRNAIVGIRYPEIINWSFLDDLSTDADISDFNIGTGFTMDHGEMQRSIQLKGVYIKGATNLRAYKTMRYLPATSEIAIFKISNGKISQFNIRTATIDSSRSTATLKLSGINMKGGADVSVWRAKTRWLFPHAHSDSMNAKARITFNDVSIEQTVEMTTKGQFSSARPTDCRVNIGSLDIDVTGDEWEGKMAANVSKKIISLLNNKFKIKVANMICSNVQPKLADYIKKALD